MTKNPHASPNYAPRFEGKEPDLVIIHATATPGWDSPYGWLRNPQKANPKRRVSAHSLIGTDGREVELVDEKNEAWHAGLSFWPGFASHHGSLNWRSAGKELVNSNTGKMPYPEAQLEATAQSILRTCRRWNIPITRNRIVGHWEVSPGRKTDPRGLDLDALVARVRGGIGVEGLAVVAKPRVGLEQFRRSLESRKSPAAPLAADLYAICVEEGIDPAVFLAMFIHESSAGLRGICFDYDTKNPGNVRSPEVPGAGLVIQTRGGPFVRYASWQEGTRDWCRRLKGRRYAGAGLHTIEAIIPVYAPSSDRNKPDRYITEVLEMIRGWQSTVELPTWNVRITAKSLNIRQGAGTEYPIVGILSAGDVVSVDGQKIEKGGPFLHLADHRGFIAEQHTARV